MSRRVGRQAGRAYLDGTPYVSCIFRCYKLVNQQLSYQDARSWCRYQNSVVSYLATVSDQITASFLACKVFES